MSGVQVSSAAEQWRRRITEQDGSELSITAYCARHGLANSSFHYWKRRLRDESAASVSNEDRFVRVNVGDSAPAITIECPDGWTLRVPCDEQALRLVLRVLDERRC